MEDRKTCTKMGYKTAAAATRAMKAVIDRKGSRMKKHVGGLKLAAYKCTKCGDYHWGHWGTKAAPKRKN